MVPRRDPPLRFLNRDVEHEQLKSSVKEAEVRVQMEMLERSNSGATDEISAESAFSTHENES